MTPQRLKDKAAWFLIYGGTTIAQVGIISAAVAAGFVDRTAARVMSRAAGKISPSLKRSAWKKYQETGSIADALNEFF